MGVFQETVLRELVDAAGNRKTAEAVAAGAGLSLYELAAAVVLYREQERDRRELDALLATLDAEFI